MEQKEFKSSILLSIFKRKGGEGIFTKIVDNENKLFFSQQILLLPDDEKPLLCYKKNDFNWILMSNYRIIGEEHGISLNLPYHELASVSFSFLDEFVKQSMSKEKFTTLIICNDKNEKFNIELEEGKPIQGIYQVLHYIISSRNN